MNKKEKIKKLALEMLDDSKDHMADKIEKALNSGAVDIDGWDENIGKMILPKSILCACLLSEVEQYNARGTSFEKVVEEEIKNLRYFI